MAAVAAANPHTIVVMENGGAQVMPWLASVSAVMEAWFPGQMGGPAIANLLFGAVNPSGKLPITFPASVDQLPNPVIATADSATPFPVNYSEGFNVGYKWYDAHDSRRCSLSALGSLIRPSRSRMRPSAITWPRQPQFPGYLNLTNTGTVAGAEVAQVYLAFPASR